MKAITPGELWVADIPFTSQTASKKRPVLVLWLDAADVVVAAVTTAAPRSVSDVHSVFMTPDLIWPFRAIADWVDRHDCWRETASS